MGFNHIAIDMGHTLSGLGTGAVGIVKETDINRKVGNLVIKYLKEQGKKVTNCTVDYSGNDLYDRVALANKSNADLFVSIHCNSGGGHGSETFVYDGNYAEKEENKVIAKSVNDALVNSCGFRNRGVKEANFYVIRETKMKAILVELFFVDSAEDNSKYDADKIARALVKGITGNDTLNQNQVNTSTPSNFPCGVGSSVQVIGNNYATGQSIPSWVKANNYNVIELNGNKALLSGIMSWVYVNDLKVLTAGASQTNPVVNNKPSISVGTKVKIIGNNYSTGQVIPQWVKNNTYSVIQKGDGKSLLGDIVSWVYDKDLSVVGTNVTIPVQKKCTVGSAVKIKGNNYATGQTVPAWVKNNNYNVIEISGDKALLGGIMSWVYVKDLTVL